MTYISVLKLVSLVLVLVILLVGGQPITFGQNDPSIVFDFAVYEGNPVLPNGGSGAWDAMIFLHNVVYHDDLFHMFYYGWSGNPDDPLGTGYATSEDGLQWTKYDDNPVFVLDEAIAPTGGARGVLAEDGQWIMYVCAMQAIGEKCVALLRATAPEPTVGWVVEPTPVLEAGGVLEWDHDRIIPISLVKTANEYVLYYDIEDANAVGYASSPDGIVWAKYDDPTTTGNLYEFSDPVFETGTGRAWDAGWIAGPLVRVRDDGMWEMFYMGGNAEGSGIGYATSTDGITWTRYADNPVLEAMPGMPMALVVVDDVYFIYYFDFEALNVGLVTGTVTWE
jgi:hypothetical protein